MQMRRVRDLSTKVGGGVVKRPQRHSLPPHPSSSSSLLVPEGNILYWHPIFRRVDRGAKARSAVTLDGEKTPPRVIFFPVPIQGG